MRLVEVNADPGTPRARYASGCIVAGRTVLTAAHAVAGAKRVIVRDTEKHEWPCRIDSAFIGSTDADSGPDIALVEILGDLPPLPPMGLARVDRDSSTGEPVERVRA